MKFKAFAVIDTNVLISSVLTPGGFLSRVFDLVGSGNIIPIFDETDPLERTVTPESMIHIMAECQSMLEVFEKQMNYEIDYSQSVNEKINQYLSTSKYDPGEELIDKIFDTENREIKDSFFER